MNTKRQYHHIMLINKYGGLMFSKTFGDTKISSDAKLMAAATFHGISSLTQLVVPPQLDDKNKSSQMPNKIKLETIVVDSFKLYSYETLTGLQFVVIADPNTQEKEAKNFLKQLYEAFTDHVLKDPFFVPEQLIKNQKFEQAIQQLMD